MSAVVEIASSVVGFLWDPKRYVADALIEKKANGESLLGVIAKVGLVAGGVFSLAGFSTSNPSLVISGAFTILLSSVSCIAASTISEVGELKEIREERKKLQVQLNEDLERIREICSSNVESFVSQLELPSLGEVKTLLESIRTLTEQLNQSADEQEKNRLREETARLNCLIGELGGQDGEQDWRG